TIVIRSFLNRSPETYALGSAVGAVLIAALLTRTPAVAFGNFWQMTATLLTADLLVYTARKLGWLRMPRIRK
ncbi:MAG: hypothetical protein ABJB49_02315, partial [Nitrospirota bacterium]